MIQMSGKIRFSISMLLILVFMMQAGELKAQKKSIISKIEVAHNPVNFNVSLQSDSPPADSVNFDNTAINSDTVNVLCVIHFVKLFRDEIKSVQVSIGNFAYDNVVYSGTFALNQLTFVENNLDKTISLQVPGQILSGKYFYSVTLFDWSNNIITKHSTRY